MLVAAVFALLLNTATRHQFDMWGTELPPPAYDYYPTQPVMRLAVPLNDVTATCFAAPVPFIAFGCTKWTPADISAFLYNPNVPQALRNQVKAQFTLHSNLCLIIYPQISDKVPFARQWSILRHENVHCGGLIHDQTGLGWYKPDGTIVPGY